MFILRVLAHQEADSALIIIPQQGPDLLNSAVLAPESQQQHPAGVRMGSQVRQHLPGVFLVAPQLAASVRMSKRVNTLDASAGQPLRLPGQRFCHVADAAHRR